MSQLRFLPWGVLGLAAGLAGCGPTARQSDPALARETLCRALDAWRSGASPEELRKSAPPVTVVERQWQKGGRLVRYEVNGDGEPDGFDVRFPVKLSLEEPGGKKVQRTAFYNVSTSPSLVVVASDSGG